jgi:site-specific DNA recombinase
MLCDMQAIGYVRVSTDRQAEQGVSLEAQEAKIRAMATVQSAELLDVIIDGRESAKSLNRPGLQRLLALINSGNVQAVIVAKLDRLTRSVKDLCGLLELFEKRKVALISVAESLDTGSAAGRLVITIMGAVSQWEREAIGERTRDALHHKRSQGQRVGNIAFGSRLARDGQHLELEPVEQAALVKFGGCAVRVRRSVTSQPLSTTGLIGPGAVRLGGWNLWLAFSKQCGSKVQIHGCGRRIVVTFSFKQADVFPWRE